jgi:phosphomannomutase
MAAKFGTSGLRGLIEELVEGAAARHARGFARHLIASGASRAGDTVYIGRDFRDSSPVIASQCMAALAAEGLVPVDCGALPTPALAFHAMSRKAASLMVTGSHIPADRNGVKFYRPDGEIDKTDEIAIGEGAAGSWAGWGSSANLPQPDGALEQAATDAFVTRYRGVIADGALAGCRIGIYEHSTVARDVLARVLEPTGATLVRLGRSESFIPVDTEAVTDEVRALIAGWTQEHRLDALVTADGDGDRPLLADEAGQCVRGDVVGLIAARELDASVIVTPITSSSGIEGLAPGSVMRTRVGSPYVIAAMDEAARAGKTRILGFEANGGLLTQTAFIVGRAELSPLPTRDCMLPLLAALAATLAQGVPISQGVAQLGLPAAQSGLIRPFPTETAQALIGRLVADEDERREFFRPFGEAARVDLTDGLRVIMAGGAIIHLRPSGNAPEMRCYVEAANAPDAALLADRGMARVREWASRSG